MKRMIALSLALGVAVAAEDVGKKFWIRQGLPPEEVVKLVGEPSARYRDGDEACWLYGDVVKEEGGRRTCPELLFRKDRFIQTNWLPEDVMRRSVGIAKGFGDWQPPATVEPKGFFVLADTALSGRTHAEVAGKLGQPDAKKVFNGKEVWVYRRVRMAPDREQELTVYVTFEDGKVTETAGN